MIALRTDSFLVGCLVFIFLVVHSGTARAQSFPSSKPLFYSGYLTNKNGTALASPQLVGIALWKSNTSTTTQNKVCSVSVASTPLVQGRFRLELPTACVTAIRDNADLWVEATVGTNTLPRTKIGAVPYVASIPKEIKKTGNAELTIHSNTSSPTASAKMLTLKTGSTTPKEVFSIDTEGKVGIGNSSPVGKLDVKGLPGGKVALRSQGNSGEWAGEFIGDNAGPSRALKIRMGDGKTKEVGFAINSQDDSKSFFSVKGNGNVGIGTNNQESPLEVAPRMHVVCDGTKEESGFSVGSHWSGGTSGGKGRLKLWYKAGPVGYVDVKEGGKANSSAKLLLLPFGGSIGVGTSTPKANLDINGSLRVGNCTLMTRAGNSCQSGEATIGSNNGHTVCMKCST